MSEEKGMWINKEGRTKSDEEEISERHKAIIAECERKANEWRDLTDEGRYIKILEAKLRKSVIDTRNITKNWNRKIKELKENNTALAHAMIDIDCNIDDFCKEKKYEDISSETNRLIREISEVYLENYNLLLEYKQETKENFREEMEDIQEFDLAKDNWSTDRYDDYDPFSNLEKYRDRVKVGARRYD